MPTRGSTSMRRVIPIGIRFCMAIITISREIMITKSLPPCFNTFRSLWNPTQVKNASIKTSISVLSKDTSIWNHVYNARVSNENIMPPLTGEGMQNFCRNDTLRVNVIPTSRAREPMPAVCIMSSPIVVIL